MLGWFKGVVGGAGWIGFSVFGVGFGRWLG